MNLSGNDEQQQQHHEEMMLHDGVGGAPGSTQEEEGGSPPMFSSMFNKTGDSCEEETTEIPSLDMNDVNISCDDDDSMANLMDKSGESGEFQLNFHSEKSSKTNDSSLNTSAEVGFGFMFDGSVGGGANDAGMKQAKSPSDTFQFGSLFSGGSASDSANNEENSGSADDAGMKQAKSLSDSFQFGSLFSGGSASDSANNEGNSGSADGTPSFFKKLFNLDSV